MEAMEPDDIEFVGSEEPLPPARSESPTPDRPWRVFRVLVAAAVVAGGLVWAMTRSSGQGHDPVAVSPSPSPSSPSSPSNSKVAPTPTDPASLDYRSTAAGKAFAQYLPNATITNITVTYTADPSLGRMHTSTELIEAHQDSVEVLLRVRPYQGPQPEPTTGITPTPPGLGSAFFHFETASSVVDVEWIGTDSTPPPVGALESLADDPRLESLS